MLCNQPQAILGLMVLYHLAERALAVLLYQPSHDMKLFHTLLAFNFFPPHFTNQSALFGMVYMFSLCGFEIQFSAVVIWGHLTVLVKTLLISDYIICYTTCKIEVKLYILQTNKAVFSLSRLPWENDEKWYLLPKSHFLLWACNHYWICGLCSVSGNNLACSHPSRPLIKKPHTTQIQGPIFQINDQLTIFKG